MSATSIHEKAPSVQTQVRRGCCHKNLNKDAYRRACGCLRTSDKLKQILTKFPSPPPPSPDLRSVTPTLERLTTAEKHATKDRLPTVERLSTLERFPTEESLASVINFFFMLR